MSPTEPTWKHYLTDYNEGLGLVYERFVLNDFLNLLRMRFNIRSVLEAPLYGMAGVSGINDVVFARHGVQVTLVDDDPERLRGVRRIWEEDLHLPAEFVAIPPTGWDRLPFADRSFDLTWQWAGLWYLADPEGLLRELARTSRKLVFVAMPNNLQVGYWMRKLVIDREFFATHDERWTDIGRIRRILESAGVEIIDEGVLDVPPWPDTVMFSAKAKQTPDNSTKHRAPRSPGDRRNWGTMT
jgi:SAM-dependent methyltransferase